MKKRRVYWPHGNPQFDAWQFESPAGILVVRRNHPLATKDGSCHGWDIWLGEAPLGAVGSRSLTELASLFREAPQRNEAYAYLSEMDATHLSTYDVLVSGR